MTMYTGTDTHPVPGTLLPQGLYQPPSSSTSYYSLKGLSEGLYPMACSYPGFEAPAWYSCYYGTYPYQWGIAYYWEEPDVRCSENGKMRYFACYGYVFGFNANSYDYDCDGIPDSGDTHPGEPEDQDGNLGDPGCLKPVGK